MREFWHDPGLSEPTMTISRRKVFFRRMPEPDVTRTAYAWVKQDGLPAAEERTPLDLRYAARLRRSLSFMVLQRSRGSGQPTEVLYSGRVPFSALDPGSIEPV